MSHSELTFRALLCQPRWLQPLPISLSRESRRGLRGVTLKQISLSAAHSCQNSLILAIICCLPAKAQICAASIDRDGHFNSINVDPQRIVELEEAQRGLGRHDPALTILIPVRIRTLRHKRQYRYHWQPRRVQTSRNLAITHQSTGTRSTQRQICQNP